VIDSDGKDKWIEIEKCDQDFLRCAPSKVIQRIHWVWIRNMHPTFKGITSHDLSPLNLEHSCPKLSPKQANSIYYVRTSAFITFKPFTVLSCKLGAGRNSGCTKELELF
jgi:hypothetical protein